MIFDQFAAMGRPRAWRRLRLHRLPARCVEQLEWGGGGFGHRGPNHRGRARGHAGERSQPEVSPAHCHSTGRVLRSSRLRAESFSASSPFRSSSMYIAEAAPVNRKTPSPIAMDHPPATPAASAPKYAALPLPRPITHVQNQAQGREYMRAPYCRAIDPEERNRDLNARRVARTDSTQSSPWIY